MTDRVPWNMLQRSRTMRGPSHCPGLIYLPSGVDCSLSRYDVWTKIFAPNSQVSDLLWSVQDLNHSFLRLMLR